jgi:hypothetical protein
MAQIGKALIYRFLLFDFFLRDVLMVHVHVYVLLLYG